jgi:hypothetical protein
MNFFSSKPKTKTKNPADVVRGFVDNAVKLELQSQSQSQSQSHAQTGAAAGGTEGRRKVRVGKQRSHENKRDWCLVD